MMGVTPAFGTAMGLTLLGLLTWGPASGTGGLRWNPSVDPRSIPVVRKYLCAGGSFLRKRRPGDCVPRRGVWARLRSSTPVQVGVEPVSGGHGLCFPRGPALPEPGPARGPARGRPGCQAAFYVVRCECVCLMQPSACLALLPAPPEVPFFNSH